MDKQDWLAFALADMHSGQWYGWKKDWTGEHRMSYENIITDDLNEKLKNQSNIKNEEIIKKEKTDNCQELKNIAYKTMLQKKRNLSISSLKYSKFLIILERIISLSEHFAFCDNVRKYCKIVTTPKIKIYNINIFKSVDDFVTFEKKL